MDFKTDYSKRIYGLDIFRAVAILLVVHGHGRWMLTGTFLEGFPWIRLTDGVELFFVLSGFLIGRILLKTITADGYQLSLPKLLNFWKRRWFRTLPNYYLILGLNLLFVYVGFIDGNLEEFNFQFLLFLHNFSGPFVDFFWESWSLSVEEWFYIILPIALLWILKVSPSRRGILAVILVLIALPLFYRISQVGEQVDPFWWDVKFRKVVIMRLDTIIYGVLAAYIKFYHAGFWKKIAWPAFFVGLAMVMCIEYIPKDINGFFAKTFYFNGATIGSMLLLPLADSYRQARTRFGKVITHISLISYSMYLVNLGLVSQVIMKHFPISSPNDGLGKYFLYWGIVVGLSTLLYFFFERPVLELREKKWFRK